MREGLTWYTDKYIKFRNPTTDNLTLAEVFEGKGGIFFFLSSEIILCHILNVFPTGTAPPPYWQKPVYKLDPSNPMNNGFINDDFIVWMREAAFPNFKKLYGILFRNDNPFTKGLPAGNYSIDITYSILSLC